MEVSVLERQQARLSWLWLLQQHNYDELQNNPTQFLPLHEANSNNNIMTQEMSSESDKLGGTGNDMESFGHVMVSSGMKQFLSWNVEEEMRMKEDKGEDFSLVKNMKSVDSGNNSKKRKAETITSEKSSEKCIKRDAEKEESRVKEKGNREASPDTSKGNSLLPEVKKPDYIHVRARRGEATDSHSLAERARREKISKKMKCLQDLVPGCSKAMGKAGMLDEIINYVQSLQRQVEFLSMKLAAINPRVDFKFEDLLAKEFPACVTNFQATTSSPAIASLAFNQLYPAQHAALDISTLTNSTREASEQKQVQQLPMCDTDFLGISVWDSNKEQSTPWFPLPTTLAELNFRYQEKICRLVPDSTNHEPSLIYYRACDS